MNITKGLLNLVTGLINIVLLFGFIVGVFHPTKLYIVMTMLFTIGVLLTWSANDFSKASD